MKRQLNQRQKQRILGRVEYYTKTGKFIYSRQKSRSANLFRLPEEKEKNINIILFICIFFFLFFIIIAISNIAFASPIINTNQNDFNITLYEKEKLQDEYDAWLFKENEKKAFIKEQETKQKEIEENKQIILENEKNNNSSTLNKYDGIYFYNNKKETYYSSKVLWHKDTHKWYVDDEGFYHNKNGFYVVASIDYNYGTIINTSKGKAIVLDCGCPANVVDFYVNW